MHRETVQRDAQHASSTSEELVTANVCRN